MYFITVEKDFDAAHFLRNYRGKCENLHGHRYVVRVTIKATKLDDNGLAYDFTALKQELGEILARFDHTNLNDITPFDKINPSAENIATTIYKKLKPKLKGEPVTIDKIEVWESPTSKVTYTPE
jgi:6-pyruvoyltetrahydropterin/6-carboxytetrahydropterin synthase